MKITSDILEREALLETARLMAAAARTAPKARGCDNLETFVLMKEDFGPLVAEMEKLAHAFNRPGMARDAGNLERAGAIIFIGTKLERIGLGEACRFCGFDNCEANRAGNGVCVYNPGDLGIAVGSAVSAAADRRVDTRVMYSAGKAALALGLFSEDVKIALAIPLSISGKNPFFDRT
jgi:uncharacterized ferredoxin-like protein